MTREEKSVWRAVYGCAFAQQAQVSGGGDDDMVRAVRAIEVADRAIRALRDRRLTGDSRAGSKVWS